MPKCNYELVELKKNGNAFTLDGKEIDAKPVLTEMKIPVPTYLKADDIVDYIKREAKSLADFSINPVLNGDNLATRVGIVIKPGKKGEDYTYRLYRIFSSAKVPTVRDAGAELAVDIFGD